MISPSMVTRGVISTSIPTSLQAKDVSGFVLAPPVASGVRHGRRHRNLIAEVERDLLAFSASQLRLGDQLRSLSVSRKWATADGTAR